MTISGPMPGVDGAQNCDVYSLSFSPWGPSGRLQRRDISLPLGLRGLADAGRGRGLAGGVGRGRGPECPRKTRSSPVQKLRWQWKVCEGGVIAQRLDRFDYHKLANPWPKPRCHLSLSGTNRRRVLNASEKRNDSNTGPVCQSRPHPARPVFPEQTHGNISPKKPDGDYTNGDS